MARKIHSPAPLVSARVSVAPSSLQSLQDPFRPLSHMPEIRTVHRGCLLVPKEGWRGGIKVAVWGCGGG